MKHLLALALALAAGAACAQSVSLQGMLGSKALLIVDGSAPKGVAVGETHKGVKVLATQGDQATLEFGGRRHVLRLPVASEGEMAAGPAASLPARAAEHASREGLRLGIDPLDVHDAIRDQRFRSSLPRLARQALDRSR